MRHSDYVIQPNAAIPRVQSIITLLSNPKTIIYSIQNKEVMFDNLELHIKCIQTHTYGGSWTINSQQQITGNRNKYQMCYVQLSYFQLESFLQLLFSLIGDSLL